MAKRDKSKAEIQELLAERRKLEQWLDRLAETADKTTQDVRERVESDYRARLDKVNGRLQSFVDDIREARDAQQSTFDELKEKEEKKSKELAEAELRHAVGEYGEDEWKKLKSGILEELVSIREGLGDVEEEIEELEGVLAALEDREPEGKGDRDDEAAEDELPPIDLEEDEEPKAPAGKRGSSQTDAFGDELEFLKSVTEDEEQGPAPGRASGSMRAIPDEEIVSGTGSGRRGRKAARTPSGERTLRCAECGAMNLPTEWYCERCGAELASL